MDGSESGKTHCTSTSRRSRPVSIDSKVSKLKELTDKRDDLSTQIATLQDEIRGELSSLMGQFAPMKGRGKRGAASASTRVCSICGKMGHNARTCADKDTAAAKPKSKKGKPATA